MPKMNRLVWGFLPLPAIVLLLAALRASIDPTTVFEPGWLLPVTNIAFITLVDLIVASVALRTFSARGQVQIYLLGCGALVFGLAGACAALVRELPDGANLTVAIHNTGSLAAAIIFFAAAVLLLAGRSPTIAAAQRTRAAAGGYLAAVIVVGLLTAAALNGAIAPFYSLGMGHTAVRQDVLGTATGLFAVAALVFFGTSIRTREPFLYWYALALTLVCVGLAAILIESSVGSPISWAGWLAQYLGGLYLLAALAAAPSSAGERKSYLGSIMTFSLSPAAAEPGAATTQPASSIEGLDRSLRHIYLEASSDAFYVKDAEGRYLLFNSEAARATGKQASDVIGKDDTFLFPANQAASVRAHDREVMDGGRVVTYEEVLQTVAGPTTYLATTGPVFDDNGKVVGLFGIARDLTEQKRAEASLRDSEDRYRALFESASDAVFVIDMATTQILDANAMASVLYGYSHTELLAMTDSDVSAEPDETARRTREAATADDQVVRIPLRLHRKKDGTVFPVDLTARNAEWHDRRVLIVAVRDISERQASEEALRASQEQLRLVRDSSEDSIYSFDLQGRFTSANRRFCQALGLGEEQIIGRTPPEVGLPQDRFAELAAIHMDVIMSDRTVVREVAMPMPDGQVRFAELVMNPIHDRDGRVVGIAETSRDITERKLAEADNANLQVQLQQAQKMESVGRLAGGVAHDFNNMLGAILGNTELALEELGPTHPVWAQLMEIQGAARYSADLTRQLLAFARRTTVAPQILDLNAAMGGMLDLLRRLIGEGIELAWQPGAGLWPVRVDPSQVQQVVTNLVVNARDAVGETGSITIETANCTLDAVFCATRPDARPGDYAVLTVRDNGRGMDAETIARVFEPFFTTKEAGRGTGLGLATVYGIVTQSEGFITVTSAPSEGTTLAVYLPRHGERPARPAERPQPHAGHRGSETILLVEDEPAILRLGVVMLQRLGYRVIAAATPGEAIRLARENAGNINLLITDVVMPEMNGRDLARNLLTLYPDLARLFMSGYTADVIAHHGVLDESVHFLQKPFSGDDLAAKVREALDAGPGSGSGSGSASRQRANH